MNDICLLALGGNLPSRVGTPNKTIAAALKRLNCADISLCAVSRFYSTPCFPSGAGPDYVNAVASVQTSLTPAELLSRLHTVEADFGRNRQQRWGMRTLDLDLISFNSLVLPDVETQTYWQGLSLQAQLEVAPEKLVLPHPRMQDRAFVLGPICDIAPDWTHPVSGECARDLLVGLPVEDQNALIPL
ncbi:2-amino-4-hydroxy-6-hydroxymethyldihydropteridine diphosphokinase [Pseudopelagicola sp. nBUS_19]|uniref:2-amino-4-hydroxy-6- hydroxymethyldihydropteridine diphosphokinase n=1 Tax=Pseudopelagicola sp. nBUS_19 TaxID=3395316 RepID=UPI003EBCD3A9